MSGTLEVHRWVVVVVAVVYGLRALLSLACLASLDYPRRIERTRGNDAWTVVLSVVLVVFLVLALTEAQL